MGESHLFECPPLVFWPSCLGCRPHLKHWRRSHCLEHRIETIYNSNLVQRSMGSTWNFVFIGRENKIHPAIPEDETGNCSQMIVILTRDALRRIKDWSLFGNYRVIAVFDYFSSSRDYVSETIYSNPLEWIPPPGVTWLMATDSSWVTS